MTPIEAPTPAFFFSDVHLGFEAPDAERVKRERLLRFFEVVRASGRSLFCLGDLFDFWFEYESAIPAQHFEVLRRLKELSEAGIELYFMGGNHDYWVRRGHRPGFLEREIGFRLLEEGVEVHGGGLRLLLYHGDGLGSGDLGYRILKRVLRNRLAIGAFRWVHPDLARRIALLTAGTSRFKSGGEPSQESCARIRERALEILHERPDLDAVLVGHTHHPEEEALAGSRYLNLGDWMRHATYAHLEQGSLSLRRFQAVDAPAGAADSARLRTGLPRDTWTSDR